MSSTASGALSGGLMAGLMSNPWTLPIGIGLGALGGFFGGRASQPKLMQLPPPSPLFPQAQGQYMQQMFGGNGQVGSGPQALNVLNWFLNNQGGPTDYTNLFQTTAAAGMTGTEMGRAALKEKYGGAGMRFSRPMADAAALFEAENSKNLAQLLAQLAYSSNEAAAGRSVNIAQNLMPFFREPAMSFYPSAQLVTGGQSGIGQAMSTAGSSLQTLSLLSMMGLI